MMRPGFCGRQDIVLKVLLLLCGAVLLTGCRKELCYDHDHWTANVVADWELVWVWRGSRAGTLLPVSPMTACVPCPVRVSRLLYTRRAAPMLRDISELTAVYSRWERDVIRCSSTTTIRSTSCSAGWTPGWRLRLRPVPAPAPPIRMRTERKVRSIRRTCCSVRGSRTMSRQVRPTPHLWTCP